MTELDHTVLAIIARDGPMSAYDVRKVFAGSLTPGWSSSTGSIYPSIRRLSENGLVSLAAPRGGRDARAVTVTGAGEAALERWLTGDTKSISAATPDPIRTRCYFLSLMDDVHRRNFLADALHHTQQALAAAEAGRGERLAAGTDPLLHLVSEGVVYQLRARRDWLRAMMDGLGLSGDAVPGT